MTDNKRLRGFIRRGRGYYFPFSVQGSYSRRYLYYLRILKGYIEAILRLQSNRLCEPWKELPRKRLKEFLRVGEAGKDHPSRVFAASLVRKGESILDIGCGAGVNYETLEGLGLAQNYTGIDSSLPSIESAKELYPKGDFRFCNAYDTSFFFNGNKFDVIIVRAVLEHLPDFEKVMSEAIGISKRLAVFIFFIPPRNLPFGIRKINVYIDPPFYTNVYSKDAIEKFLAKSNLSYKWYYDVGRSGAGWLRNENNSVLVITKE